MTGLWSGNPDATPLIGGSVLPKGTTQPLRKTCWALTAGSVALWGATMGLAVEYAHQWAGPARSVIEGVAITATVCLVVVAIGRWIESRGSRRARAAVDYVVTRPVYGSPPLTGGGDITMEILRQRSAVDATNVVQLPPTVMGKAYRLGRSAGSRRP